MSVNQQNLIRRTFNIGSHVAIAEAVKYNIGHSKAHPADKPLDIPQGSVPDAPLYTSKLGTPVFADIHFTWKAYTANNGRSMPGGELKLDCVLLSVTRPNKIVKTEIQGKDGTVKEYIGKDDFQIQMSGVITGDNGVYPQQQLKALKEMVDVPTEIGVASRHLQTFGIVNVVVDTPDFPQSEGSYSYQAFSISFLSDEPRELRISI